MLSETIQKQITIGDCAKFLRKDGVEITGRLIELDSECITLECSGNATTILIEMIGGWEVLQDKAPSENYHEESLRIILEVESRFQSKLATPILAPPSPDFDLSTERLRGKHVISTLDRVKSSYEYAVKVNELGAQFGRIQPLLLDLSKLLAKYPDSKVISRLLGYFYWLVGDVQKAFEMYSRVALASGSARDWLGLAVTAEDDAISCYAFNKVYSRTGIPIGSDAWYVYVNYIAKHRNFSSIADTSVLLENHDSKDIGGILLEACLYLLLESGERDSATALASRSISGEELKVLVNEAINLLVDQSDSVSKEYMQATESFRSMQSLEPKQESSLQSKSNVLTGHIYAYKTDRIFGFIEGDDGKTYCELGPKNWTTS